ARLPEKPCFRQSFLAVADDDHLAILDPHEDGEGVQLGGGTHETKTVLLAASIVAANPLNLKKRPRLMQCGTQSVFRGIGDWRKNRPPRRAGPPVGRNIPAPGGVLPAQKSREPKPSSASLLRGKNCPVRSVTMPGLSLDHDVWVLV